MGCTNKANCSLQVIDEIKNQTSQIFKECSEKKVFLKEDNYRYFRSSQRLSQIFSESMTLSEDSAKYHFGIEAMNDFIHKHIEASNDVAIPCAMEPIENINNLKAKMTCLELENQKGRLLLTKRLCKN